MLSNLNQENLIIKINYLRQLLNEFISNGEPKEKIYDLSLQLDKLIKAYYEFQA